MVGKSVHFPTPIALKIGTRDAHALYIILYNIIFLLYCTILRYIILYYISQYYVILYNIIGECATMTHGLPIS